MIATLIIEISFYKTTTFYVGSLFSLSLSKIYHISCEKYFLNCYLHLFLWLDISYICWALALYGSHLCDVIWLFFYWDVSLFTLKQFLFVEYYCKSYMLTISFPFVLRILDVLMFLSKSTTKFKKRFVSVLNPASNVFLWFWFWLFYDYCSTFYSSEIYLSMCRELLTSKNFRGWY